MEGYTNEPFNAPIRSGHQIEHEVFRKGEGAAVVILQELPGVNGATLALADRIIAQGLRVVIPQLVGPMGKLSLLGNTVRAFCMRKELHLFAKDSSSPIVDWLQALCSHERERSEAAGEPTGVGVIGMCLTGNFAITLIAHDAVQAAVASQPSMPLRHGDALHMSDTEIAASRAALDTKGAMLAYRFEDDGFCTAARFEAIDKAFNEDQERVRTRVLPGKKHSVLTLDFVDERGHPTKAAMDEVLNYFSEKL